MTGGRDQRIRPAAGNVGGTALRRAGPNRGALPGPRAQELLTILLGLVTAALLALEHQGAWNFVKSVFHFRFSFLEHHKTTTSIHLHISTEDFIPTVAMNKNQLSPVPQTAFTPKPSSSPSSGGEQVHSSVASPASGLAASPSPATGLTIVQSVSCPGTYIQIPVTAEVCCVSTFSLPAIVQKKIYGGTCNVPKGCCSSKSTTAIYICPVNPVKLSEAKCLMPLMHKPLQSDNRAQSVTDSVEKPISSSAAEVTSKETSSRRQDKMNRAEKEGTATPTPVSVRFCNNLASEVLKTYVKQQGKQNSMEDIMQTYFNNPLDVKTASSFKDNALLLFNGQLFFLAHKGVDMSIGADKGKLPTKESGTDESKVAQGGPGHFKQRIDTGHTSTSSSGLGRDTDSSGTRCELKVDRKECVVKRDAIAITRQNGLEAQQVVKRLPNSLPGSCVKRLTFSENRALLLKAGIHSEVRVCLDRISMNGKIDASGHQLEHPIKCTPQFSKTLEPVNLEECPKLSREIELAKLKECPEIIRECDPLELKECPKLSREVDFGDLEENSDTSKIPAPFPSQECPELSKESGPVVMEECAAISRVSKSAQLEGCPRISRDASPVTLEEHGYSKNNVSVALRDDGDTHIIPKSADFREHLEPTANLGSADLEDCFPESDEECQSECRRKRKEVEIEIRSSGCVIPNLDNDKSATNKRRKHNEGLASSEASESPRETCGLPNVGKLKNAEAAPIPPYSLLELNKEQSESISQDGFHPPEQENPLEVDETVRDEKINRLKEILKEKQAALERMRKKVSPSSSESCSILEPL